MPNPKRFITDPGEMDIAVDQALNASNRPAALRKLAWETQWGPRWTDQWRCCAAPMKLASAQRIYGLHPDILGEAFAPHLRRMACEVSPQAQLLVPEGKQDWPVMLPIMAGILTRAPLRRNRRRDEEEGEDHAVEIAKTMSDAQLCEAMAMTYGLKWRLQGIGHAHMVNPLASFFFFTCPAATWLGSSESLRAMLTARGWNRPNALGCSNRRGFVLQRAYAALASGDPRAAALAAGLVDLLLWNCAEPSADHRRALLAAACDEQAARKILAVPSPFDWLLPLKAQILHMHPVLRKPSEQGVVYRRTA